MTRIRIACALLLLSVVTGCGVFESARPVQSTRDRDYLSTEYGDAPPATVSVQINGQAQDFRVRVGTKHSRIMVEATPAAAEATTGAISKLSLGIVDRPIDQTPYREAAIRYLAESGGTGCELKTGGQIAPNRVEWRFDCAQPPAAAAPAPRGTSPPPKAGR